MSFAQPSAIEPLVQLAHDIVGHAEFVEAIFLAGVGWPCFGRFVLARVTAEQATDSFVLEMAIVQQGDRFRQRGSDARFYGHYMDRLVAQGRQNGGVGWIVLEIAELIVLDRRAGTCVNRVDHVVDGINYLADRRYMLEGIELNLKPGGRRTEGSITV